MYKREVRQRVMTSDNLLTPTVDPSSQAPPHSWAPLLEPPWSNKHSETPVRIKATGFGGETHILRGLESFTSDSPSQSKCLIHSGIQTQAFPPSGRQRHRAVGYHLGHLWHCWLNNIILHITYYNIYLWECNMFNGSCNTFQLKKMSFKCALRSKLFWRLSRGWWSLWQTFYSRDKIATG